MPEPLPEAVWNSGELSPASFWDTALRCSRDALRTGALRPISTRANFVEDRGVEFVVRVSDNLLRKQNAPASYERPRGDNPFLPPEPELTVGSLPPHHVAVLNKFNVLENHVLVVTRGFVHQESPLTRGDFSAVTIGLSDGRGLAFYNAGRTAGASQPHKHFQLVPLPLGRRLDVPIAVLLEGAADGIDTVKHLRFRHAFKALNADPGDRDTFGRCCHEAYTDALSGLGLLQDTDFEPADGVMPRLPPYNLLLTRDWMLAAPRSTEHYADISVNGLGYAGSLFVSTPEKLDRVRTTGPMAILEKVSIPRR